MRSVPDVAFVISNLIARQHASEPILKTVFENSAEANDCGMAAVRHPSQPLRPFQGC